MNRTRRHYQRPERAGILVTALIFAVAVGVAVASLLSLARTSMKLSDRSVNLTAAIDLAEIGLEHGLWSLNAAQSGVATAWQGWTTSGPNAWRKFSGFNYQASVTGEVNVYVANYNASGPSIVTRATLTLQDGTILTRWLRVTTASRGLFPYGLLARDTITATGGAWMDSWQSDPDGDPSTPAIPWSGGVSRDNARIATVSTATPSISLGSADVYGTAAVGAGSSAGLTMSWGGRLGPHGMPISGSYNVAPGALSTGFTATFQTITAPTGATITGNYQLPRSVSGPPYYLAAESIGTTGAATILQMDQMTINGAATLTIKGDVTIHLPPSVIQTVTVAGSGRILLESGATLKIYTPGNISISGAGITNSSAPENVQIWSTRNGSNGQTISLSGSGALSAIIYAPDAQLSLPGHTDFAGAAIVKSAALTGSGAFHYDESLSNFGSGGSIAVDSYNELDTPAERAPYVAALTF